MKGLSLDDALAIIDNCIKELHTRFLIAQKNFVIKVPTVLLLLLLLLLLLHRCCLVLASSPPCVPHRSSLLLRVRC